MLPSRTHHDRYPLACSPPCQSKILCYMSLLSEGQQASEILCGEIERRQVGADKDRQTSRRLKRVGGGQLYQVSKANPRR
jgi:hypothetical protein